MNFWIWGEREADMARSCYCLFIRYSLAGDLMNSLRFFKFRFSNEELFSHQTPDFHLRFYYSPCLGLILGDLLAQNNSFLD